MKDMSTKQRMDWFGQLCGEKLIEPGIALENENIRAAIIARDWSAVARILAEEF